MSGNPGDLPPVAGGATGTTHAAPGIDDAANHGPSKGVVDGRSVQSMSVRPKATAEAPFIGDAPTEADLYERQDLSQTDGSPPLTSSAFQNVSEIRGTPAGPIVDEAADDSLFIDPGPKPADVQQGGIGDCWDMATFIGIVNRDPGKIRAMMQPDGSGGAAVTFYRRRVTDTWLGFGTPTVDYATEVVSVNNELAFDRSAASAAGTAPATDRALRALANGQPYGHQIHGAQLQAAPAPKARKWFCVVNGTTLEIHRLDVYQMARWAPILEKAAARFAEVYGQYGHGAGVSAEGEKSGGSGYADISGGFPGYTLTMFYGQAGQYTAGGQGGVSSTAWTPANAGSSALLTANQAAFDRLLTLAGRGATYTPGDTTAPIVTARALGGDSGDAAYIPRLDQSITAAVGDPDWANVDPQAQGDVTGVQTAIQAWTAATPDPTPLPSNPPPTGKTRTKQALVAAARRAADPARNPTLIATARSAPVKAMLDLLLIVKNMPVDWSQGSRSVYAGHEYSVLSVSIINTPAAPAGFNIAAMPAMVRPGLYQFVDVNASTVTVMNPHHQNEPDPTGTAADTGGVFTVNLDRFFRLYAAVMSASFDLPGGG